jgi:hypothetical protein
MPSPPPPSSLVAPALRPYYADESITLYRGDCREILPRLEGVDHVLCDPPYGRACYVGKGLELSKLAAGQIGDLDALLDTVALEIARLTRRWAIVFSDIESTGRWRDALELAGMRYVRTGAWVRAVAMPQLSGDRPGTGFEPLTIVHAPGPMRWNGGGRPALWTFGVAKGNDRPAHPCPKPEPLMAELLLSFSDPGETVLDMFAGSGSTLIAAKRLGRKAIGIEIDPAFCDVCVDRLRQGGLFTEPGVAS